MFEYFLILHANINIFLQFILLKVLIYVKYKVRYDIKEIL